MVNPIPKDFLIHEIIYEEYIGDGAFGAEWDEPKTITNVLFQYKSELITSSDGESIMQKGVIFLDRANTPDFIPLVEKSKVMFNGVSFTVLSCEHLYDFNPTTPHHYEVRVV